MTLRRSNRGTPIDMDSLIAASNVTSPAVGNMSVNAKGDKLGARGEVVQKNEDRVRAYYRDNPRSSNSRVSLKGDAPTSKLAPDTDAKPPVGAPKTAKTAAENVRTAKPAPAPEPVAEPDEFTAPQEPIGYKEVELPNGDIEMVPVYKSEDE